MKSLGTKLTVWSVKHKQDEERVLLAQKNSLIIAPPAEDNVPFPNIFVWKEWIISFEHLNRPSLVELCRDKRVLDKNNIKEVLLPVF